VAVGVDHARVHLLLEEVEDVGELGIDEPESRRDTIA
jgi:hypothetical protein